MTKATIKLFASLGEYLPPGAKQNAVEVRLAEGTTVAGALADLGVPEGLCHLVLVNGIFVPPGQRKSATIAEGDVLSVWPPVAGG
ncbi:MAG: MoaD/ThiS family protein [Kiloniellales bacterium]|jgi:sulfur carrier protein ThiS|nr:MoaD/ThiS family protein [Kiloniellales bacterium]